MRLGPMHSGLCTIQRVVCHVAQTILTKRSALAGAVVFAHTDSITSVFALAAGTSSSSQMHSLLTKLAELQRRHDIFILPRWLPRECNIVADLLSKGALESDCQMPVAGPGSMHDSRRTVSNYKDGSTALRRHH